MPQVLLTRKYWQPENRCPALMPTLIENPVIPESLLMELADTASRETVKMLRASAGAGSNPGAWQVLLFSTVNLTLKKHRNQQHGVPPK